MTGVYVAKRVDSIVDEILRLKFSEIKASLIAILKSVGEHELVSKEIEFDASRCGPKPLN